MKAAALMVMALLLLGCVNFQRGAENNTTAVQNQSVNQTANGSAANQTANGSAANQTPPEFIRYNATGFSFAFPSVMTYQGTMNGYDGTFTAIHGAGNQTFEIMIVSYVDTINTYGQNRDAEFKLDASKAASDFLEQDRTDDSAGVLDKADYAGNATVYSISRDAGAAEAPIRTHFGSLGSLFTGYAIDVYIPERSVLIRARILALDQSKADSMKQEFLLTLRPE